MNFCRFLCESELGSRWGGPRAVRTGHYYKEPFQMAVGGGFLTAEVQCLSNSAHLDVESRLSGEFFGALDGQQLLVVEGSVCTIKLRGC